MRFSDTYKILQFTLFSLFFAFFFIYLIGSFWLFPFNYLLPQHFDNFVATTLTGRLIERIGFLFCFFITIGYVKIIHDDFKFLLPSSNFKWGIKIRLFLKIAVITFICLGITYFIALFSGFISINPEGYHFILTDFFSSLYYIFLIGIIGHLLVALGEEAVYRGLVFRYLFKNTGNVNIALIISALIFSLFHFHYNVPFSFLLAFLGGYLLALVYYYSGSLVYCVSIHWAYNFFIHLFTPNSKSYLVNYFDISLRNIAGWGTYFSLFRICVFLFIIIILVLLHERDLRQKIFTRKILN